MISDRSEEACEVDPMAQHVYPNKGPVAAKSFDTTEKVKTGIHTNTHSLDTLIGTAVSCALKHEHPGQVLQVMFTFRHQNDEIYLVTCCCLRMPEGLI